MKRRNRQIILLVTAIVSCTIFLMLQTIAYRWLESKQGRFVSTVAAENTLIRLQQAHKLHGSVLFMGSSITERLLPQEDINSIAMSGSCFASSLKLLTDPHQFAPGTVYILETNNLFAGYNEKILKRVKEWDFDLFRNSSHFSIAAKPCNLITSYALYVLGGKDIKNAGVFPADIATPVDLSSVPFPTKEELAKWNHLIAGVEEIRRRGGIICFVYLPTIEIERYRHSYLPACKLAKHLNLPLLNYNSKEWINLLEYTDREHLNSRNASTVKFMNTVARDARVHAR